MSKVFKMVMNYTKNFIDKYGEENTIIVSADIENQINELEINEKKIICK